MRYKDGLKLARERVTSLEREKETLREETEQLRAKGSEETDNGQKVRKHYILCTCTYSTCTCMPILTC